MTVFFRSILVKLLEIIEFSCLTAEYMNDNVAVVEKYPGVIVSSLYAVGRKSALLGAEFYLARKRLDLR